MKILTTEVQNRQEENQAPEDLELVYKVEGLNLWYGEDHALKDVNMEIPEHQVTAIIGRPDAANRRLSKR